MNMVNNQLEGSFFFSSLTDKNQFQSFPSFKQWFTAHCKPEEFRVETVRLDALEKWCFDTERTRLAHESGRFFLSKEFMLKQILMEASRGINLSLISRRLVFLVSLLKCLTVCVIFLCR